MTHAASHVSFSFSTLPPGPRHEAHQVQPPLRQRRRRHGQEEGPQLAVSGEGVVRCFRVPLFFFLFLPNLCYILCVSNHTRAQKQRATTRRCSLSCGRLYEQASRSRLLVFTTTLGSFLFSKHARAVCLSRRSPLFCIERKDTSGGRAAGSACTPFSKQDEKKVVFRSSTP